MAEQIAVRLKNMSLRRASRAGQPPTEADQEEARSILRQLMGEGRVKAPSVGGGYGRQDGELDGSADRVPNRRRTTPS
jgi:hypothetical protein